MADAHSPAGGAKTIVDVYPLITTRHLRQVRDFSTAHFGLAVVFEARWVVMPGLPDGSSIRLGL